MSKNTLASSLHDEKSLAHSHKLSFIARAKNAVAKILAATGLVSLIATGDAHAQCEPIDREKVVATTPWREKTLVASLSPAQINRVNFTEKKRQEIETVVPPVENRAEEISKQVETTVEAVKKEDIVAEETLSLKLEEKIAEKPTKPKTKKQEAVAKVVVTAEKLAKSVEQPKPKKADVQAEKKKESPKAEAKAKEAPKTVEKETPKKPSASEAKAPESEFLISKKFIESTPEIKTTIARFDSETQNQFKEWLANPTKENVRKTQDKLIAMTGIKPVEALQDGIFGQESFRLMRSASRSAEKLTLALRTPVVGQFNQTIVNEEVNKVGFSSDVHQIVHEIFNNTRYKGLSPYGIVHMVMEVESSSGRHFFKWFETAKAATGEKARKSALDNAVRSLLNSKNNDAGPAQWTPWYYKTALDNWADLSGKIITSNPKLKKAMIAVMEEAIEKNLSYATIFEKLAGVDERFNVAKITPVIVDSFITSYNNLGGFRFSSEIRTEIAAISYNIGDGNASIIAKYIAKHGWGVAAALEANGFDTTDYHNRTKKLTMLASLEKKAHESIATESKPATIVALDDYRKDHNITSTKPVIQQVAMHTKTIVTAPAVNDANYYKSSTEIKRGMGKVIELKSALLKKQKMTGAEAEVSRKLTAAGSAMQRAEAELTASIASNNLVAIGKKQVLNGKAIREAMAVAHQVAPNAEAESTLAQGIRETETFMQNAIDFAKYQERMLARRKEEEEAARFAAEAARKNEIRMKGQRLANTLVDAKIQYISGERKAA